MSLTVPDNALLASGHYARKQLFSRNRLVAWSHSRRFATARHLVVSYAGQRLLDYGCGDGTFLALVHDLFPDAVGVDAEPDQVADCATRLRHLSGLSFATTEVLASANPARRYDVVVCMEVLEHCPEDIQASVLDDIARLTAPQGRVIVSVPIEIGPTLAAKQLVRALAARRGLSEYAARERYSAGEFARMLCATARTSIPRDESVHEVSPGRALRFTGHKGFNWRRFEGVLEERFILERRLFSPLPDLGPLLNSQVWFVLRRAGDNEGGVCAGNATQHQR